MPGYIYHRVSFTVMVSSTGMASCTVRVSLTVINLHILCCNYVRVEYRIINESNFVE